MLKKKEAQNARIYTHAGQVTTFKNKQQLQQMIDRFKSGSMACAIIHGFQR